MKIQLKKIHRIFLTINLLFVTIVVSAGNKWQDSKGWFRHQKDVINTIGNSDAQFQSTIYYNGQLWNFMHNNNQKIIIRTLTDGDDPNTISLTAMDVHSINNDHSDPFVPIPVIFKNKLVLFGRLGGYVHYTIYNDEDKTWSDFASDHAVANGLWTGSAGTVVDGKICIVGRYESGQAFFQWSDDLSIWNTVPLDLDLTSPDKQRFQAMSAIATTVVENGKKKQILMIAYINKDQHAMYATCEFDEENNLILRKDDSGLISSSDEFTSVTLAEGTVKDDPNSKGHCIQAFVKHDNTDNSNLCYRIERYEFQNKKWSQREDNLVPQKDPRVWADHDLNLNAVTYVVPEGNDMRQFMCLIYRGYDNVNHPLNCAWTETDRFIWQDDTTQKMTYEEHPEYVQYIGYIEGPPPFYLNGEPDENPYLHRDNGNPISELNYKSSNTNASGKDTDIQAGIETSLDLAYFRSELSGAYHNNKTTESSTTITQTWGRESGEHGYGLYVMIEPTYKRDHYLLNDTKGTVIDSLYYFTITKLDQNIENVTLKGGLVPSDPTTYMQRNRNLNLTAYGDTAHHFGSESHVSFDWVTENTSKPVVYKVESKDATSTGGKGSIKIGVGKENKHGNDIFSAGVTGELDIMTTTSISKESEIEISIYLDDPIETMTGQCTKLNVDMYWIKPNHSEGVDNWWMPEGAKDQDTWCITYVVTAFEKDKWPEGIVNPGKEEILVGDSVEETIANSDRLEANVTNSSESTKPTAGNSIDAILPSKTSLSQNYPNPFNPTTKIKYQIGDDNLHDNSQGNMTRLVVYNLSGKEVATLVNENKTAGSYEVDWDASNYTPGIYLYSLQSGNFREVKKLILIK